MEDWIGDEKEREERWVTVSGSLVRRFTGGHQGGGVGEDGVVDVCVADLHVSVLPFSVDDQEHAEEHGGYEQGTETHQVHPLDGKKEWKFQFRCANPRQWRDLHFGDSSGFSEPRDMSFVTHEQGSVLLSRLLGPSDSGSSAERQSPVCDSVERSAIQPLNGSISFFFFQLAGFCLISG